MPIFGLYPLQVTVNLESISPHLLVHYLPSPPHARRSPMPSTSMVHEGEQGWKQSVPSPLHEFPPTRLFLLLHFTLRDPNQGQSLHFAVAGQTLLWEVGCSFFISHSSGKHPLKNSRYLPGYPRAEVSKIWAWKPRKTGHFCAFTAQAERNKTGN